MKILLDLTHVFGRGGRGLILFDRLLVLDIDGPLEQNSILMRLHYTMYVYNNNKNVIIISSGAVFFVVVVVEMFIMEC